MLHILLLVLKIIGIILLAILGILILLVCVVLFMPVRYQIQMASEGDIEHTSVEAKAFWLLRLFAVAVNFREQKLWWDVRILWKHINQETIEKEKETEEPVSCLEKEAVTETEEPKSVEKEQKHEADPEAAAETKKEMPEDERTQDEGTTDRKEKWYDKIKYTFQKICDKIKMCLEMKEKIVAFLENEVHQKAFRHAKDEILWLLKHLWPRKIRGNVKFGFEDPYQTGQVLAGLSILYPFYEKNIEIEPDFENKILAGDVFVKSHIRGITLVIPVWRLVWDKNIRTTFRAIKNWK